MHEPFLVRWIASSASFEAVCFTFRFKSLSRDDVTRGDSGAVLLKSLVITPREAGVLLWIARGNANSEIATILGRAENKVKVHIAHIFEKLGIENYNAGTMRAMDVLSKPATTGGNG